MRVRAWDSLHHANFCKNRVRGYTRLGKIYTKNINFGDFKAHIFKATTMNFGVMVRTWNTLAVPNFVKIGQGICSLGAYFYQKFEIFVILSY